MAEHAVAWTHAALLDLQDLADFIASDQPANAAKVLDRIERRAATLASQSTRGRVVPELREVGVLHYREVIERPWRIVYRVERENVYVIAVLDARRNLQDLLLERLVRP